MKLRLTVSAVLTLFEQKSKTKSGATVAFGDPLVY